MEKELNIVHWTDTITQGTILGAEELRIVHWTD